MTYHSAIARRPAPASGGHGFHGLRLGQVACPAPNGTPEHAAYIDYCLRTWTVDVVLEGGEYLPACRLMTPQGNDREGFRRMLKFPRAVEPTADEGPVTTTITNLGDRVIVAFLNGYVLTPVVLGTLFPTAIDPDTSIPLAGEEGVEATTYVTTSADEWRDRHEVVDHSVPENPRVAYTDRRDTGASTHVEHVVVHAGATATDPSENVEARALTSSEGARTLAREHRVERREGGAVLTDMVQHADVDARQITYRHAVQETADLTHHVLVQDLGAKVLRLEQVVQEQAGLINQLLLHSAEGARVTLHHRTGDATTPDHTATIVSDGTTQHLALVKTTPDGSASLAFEADSSVVLRCAPVGQPDSWLVMEEDGTINLHSATGASLRLSQGVASVRSGGASVVVRDEQVSALTSDGGYFTLSGASAVLGAAQVTVNAPRLALQSGVVRVGSTGGGAHLIPAADVLYPKLNGLERRVARLEGAMMLHTHPDRNRPPLNPGVTRGSTATFVAPDADSLKTLKGD